MQSASEEPPGLIGGQAFRYLDSRLDKHPWLVLSDPFQDFNRVAVVNFTKWLKWKDQTCVVDPKECPSVLSLRSCVEYAGAQIYKLVILEAQLDRKQIQLTAVISQNLLDRIRQGALISDDAPYKVKELLVEQGLASEL